MAIYNYIVLSKAYIREGHLLYNEESLAFKSNLIDNRIVLSMSEHQMYFLAGFNGPFYWLNSGWQPVFDNDLMKQKNTILIMFRQLEGEKIFSKSTIYFKSKTLYRNNKVLIVELNKKCSDFIGKGNRPDRIYMQGYLDKLKRKIIDSDMNSR